MNKSTTKQRLEDRIRQANAMLDSWRAESDRGAALVAAAFLDDLIEELVRARMVPLKKVQERLLGYPGSLANGSARLDLAYALGWIGPEAYSDLSTLRRIRNHFAHSPRNSSFDEDKTRDLCKNLTVPGVTGWSFPGKDRFLVAALLQGLRLSQAIERSVEPGEAVDEPIVRHPRIRGITGIPFPLASTHTRRRAKGARRSVVKRKKERRR